MGRHSKDWAQCIGPKLWTRFLKRHFACSDLAPLNAQLLFPVTPFEQFEFGLNPEPLPSRVAPKAFDRAYELGRNPDGLYASEIFDDGSKFNLYQRVVQRVPESKYWLLKELTPYLQFEPPPIDASLRVCQMLLADLGLALVERHAVVAWDRIDQQGLKRAEENTLNALENCLLPGCLALVHALTHLAVWRQATLGGGNLSDRLLSLRSKATSVFAASLGRAGYDEGFEIGEDLCGILARCDIKTHGARSMSADESLLPDLAHHLILVPESNGVREAIRCLTRGVRALELDKDPWLPPDPAHFSAFVEPPRETTESMLQAVEGLQAASAQLWSLFSRRQSVDLGGYKGLRSGQLAASLQSGSGSARAPAGCWQTVRGCSRA